MIEAAKSFQTFAKKMEQDLSNRFPVVMEKHIEGISIGRRKDSSKGTTAGFKISPQAMGEAKYAAVTDSAPKSYWSTKQEKPLIRFEAAPAVSAVINERVSDSVAKGMSLADAQKAVKDSTELAMTYDRVERQYVVTPVVKGVNDSILSSTSVPYWNIGFMNKVFKQPYTASFASNLVSVESFGNAWADVVGVFTEAFEGYGRVSNVAKATVEGNNSNPVSNEFGQIYSDIVNIAVDYETSIEENQRAASQAGNFLSGIGIADREKYANMVATRMRDAMWYFGNAESGMLGLLDVATGGVINYAGTPFSGILAGAFATKGSLITQAMNKLIQDFLYSNKYLPTAIRINCSTAVMRALTTPVYSDVYNPEPPIKTLEGNFQTKNSLGQVQSCAWSLVADPMLDANTPFNPNASDLLVMTVPSIASAMGDQQGLVIAPETLSQFVVPPMYQRGGLLYTMYKRIGSIIAPIENTVKVYRGVGVQ